MCWTFNQTSCVCISQSSALWNFVYAVTVVFQRNYCLAKVDLSWNGLGYEGALSLAQALKTNKYLKEIDVSNNRLMWDSASVIANGLKDNSNLEVLKVNTDLHNF